MTDKDSPYQKQVRKFPIDNVLIPFNDFLRNKPVSGILLFVAVVAALIWVNFFSAHSYHALWETRLDIHFGSFEINKDLHHWINDGLMAVFFFVVGLEIKREINAGDLSSWSKASLPVAAAIGGMLVPAVIYTLFNLGESTESGWGVPMATDIAFTLGVLSLLGKRVPVSLKIFLTALAVVDDLGAVLVIAFFYTENLLLLYLEYGVGFLLLLLIGNFLGIRSSAFYAIVGICGLWVAFLFSGVHATIAGVLLAFTIPSKTRIKRSKFVNNVSYLLSQFKKAPNKEGSYLSSEQEEIIQDIKEERNKVEPPLQKLETALNPFVNFIVLPLFAFANAGVEIHAEAWSKLGEPVAIGIMLGLILGKFTGIVGFSILAVKTGISKLPENVNWGVLSGAALMAGIGFTMSIFISELAFIEEAIKTEAKLAILLASTAAGLLGILVIRFFSNKSAAENR